MSEQQPTIPQPLAPPAPRRRGRLALSLGLAVALGAGLAAAFLVAGGCEKSHASEIEVRQGPEVVRERSEKAALKAASQKAGFEVRGLGYLPDKQVALSSIDVDTGPAGLPNRVPSTTLFYSRKGDGGRKGLVAVTEVNIRPEHPANWEPERDPNVGLDVKLAGVEEVWVSATGTRTTYTVFTAARAFYIVVDDPQPSEAELTKMVASLAD